MTTEVSEQGTRLLTAAAALANETGVKLSDKIKLEWIGPDRGCGIVAVAPIAAGETLLSGAANAASVLSSELRYLWEDDAFLRFCHEVEQEPGTGADGSARLAIKLTLLLLRLARHDGADGGSGVGKPLSVLERYIAACPPTDAAPSQWPFDARTLLRGSAVHERANAEAVDLARQAADIFVAWPWAAMLSPPPTVDEFAAAFARATMLVSTRGFATETALGAMLCPVLDFVNHVCKDDARAGYRFGDAEFALEATADISEGDEVLVCYDASADFLEMWSRYGFFDVSARIHTVEIVVPADAVDKGHIGGIYWIPDAASPVDCPLLDELIGVLRGAGEASAASGEDAASPEVRRQALAKLASLVRSHLEGYPPPGPEAPEGAGKLANAASGSSLDGRGKGEDLAGFKIIAGQVLSYEQRLLHSACQKFDAIMSEGVMCS